MNQIKNLRFIPLCIVIVLLVFPFSAQAKHEHPEKFYQDAWRQEQNGQVESILPDKTRCDCITENNAVEFDFGPKWAEAIGQALYYSLQTGKKSGIVLILEKKSDYKFWIRLNSVIDHFNLPIDTWKIGEGSK